MRRKWNRPLAALLAACMLFSLLPAAAAVETVEEPDNSYSAPLPAEPAPAEDGDETQGNPETENDEPVDGAAPGSSSEEDAEPAEQEGEDTKIPDEPELPLETDQVEGNEENPLPTEEDKEEQPPLTEEEGELPTVLPDQDKTLGEVVNDAGNGVVEELLKEIAVYTAVEPDRTLEEAIADERTDVHYLTGIDTNGNGWVDSVNEAKTVELLAPVATENITTSTAIALAASITSGSQYVIRGANFTGGKKCDMHISAPNTNQCGAGGVTTVKCMEHLFTFTMQDDGTYTISNGSGYYLTTERGTAKGRECFLFKETGAKFGVTPADEEGSYYIWWETEVEPEFDGYTPEQAVEDGKTVKYLAFTGGSTSSRYWDVSGAAGDTTEIQLYTASGTDSSSTTTLATGGIEAGNYVINFDTGSSNRQAVMHYSAPTTNQCSSVSVVCGSEPFHLFVFQSAGEHSNGFTISPYSAQGMYLSLEASGNNRLFKDEATTFYVNPVSGTPGAYYLWIAEEPVDYSSLDSAQTVFTGTTQGEPFSTEDVGTQMYRIPAIITLDNGWLVAAADVRWAGWNDNPANLDTIVSVSKDNGKTWEWEVVNYFGDYANSVQGIPLSAAFIDPILVQAADGKVWMAIDVTAADGKATGGSTGYDSRNRILVAHAPAYVGMKAPASPSAYTYYVDNEAMSVAFEGKTLYAIKASSNDAESGYAVDAFMNLYKVDGETVTQEWCKQEGAELKVQTNLFYKQSAWKVFPTCFIMLRSAEVTENGLVWDDPIFPNLRYAGQTQPFFGVCPGRGTVTGDGRIIFPVYDNATGRELTSVIYSDDNGETWERGSRTSGYNNSSKTSESQIITLPDGTLRMYSRSEGSRAAHYTDSTDGGETWGATQLDSGLANGSNCMYSVINVAGTLKGPNGEVYQNVVMASYPEGNGGYSAWGNRSNGSLRLGYISGETGNWTINWLGEPKLYHGEAGTYFAYSCLTQFRDLDSSEPIDKFGVLYEPNDNANSRPNLPVDIWYKEFDAAFVLGEGWTLTQDDEPVGPQLPEGKMWAYVGFTTKWGLSAEAYTTKLYKLDSASAATGTLVTGAVEEGYYLIGAPTATDTGGARLMYGAASSTDQWSATLGDTVNVPKDETRFQLAKTADGGWTIKGVTNGKYLNVSGKSVGTYEQLPFGDESAAETFVIQAVEGGYTIAAIVTDPNYVAPEGDPPFKFPAATSGKTIVYQQVTSAGGLLTDGELFAFVDDTPDAGDPRILYHASGSDRTDQLGVGAGETLTINGGFAKERQLWSLVAVEGGCKLKSWDDGLYLTASASASAAKQLGVDETGSVFTLIEADGRFYVKSGGKYLEFNGTGGDGWKMVDTASALKVYTPTLVDISGTPAETVFKGTADKPMSQESTGSTSFRIPALLTLDNGWIVAASDIRWRTTADSPQNLDTIVSVSKDGGETWGWEVVNYWADMANNTTNQASASFIDPSIVQDENGMLHMIVDACPSYVGLMSGNRMGQACTGFDSQGRMLVAKGTADADAPTSVSAYTYYVDLNGEGKYHPICASNGTETGYSVDAFLNLYQGEDHTPVMCLQHGTTDKLVQSNLFFRQSEWKAFPTFFIMHRTATIGDEGLVWNDPQFLNVKNSNERFLGVCPGRGTIAAGGRILFPLYDNATGNELASVIYSDDNGVTWTRGARAGNLNGTGKSSESQIVVLPDGTLRMYSRNTRQYISYTDSTDGGKTWGQYSQDNNLRYGSNVMVSFINLEGNLTSPDGTVYENLILASYPWGTKVSGEHSRSNGVVRIGSVGADNTVTWLNTDDVRYEGRYNYSCLTQLLNESGKPTDRFGLLYEKDRSSNMDIHFEVLTVADLLGEGWSFRLKSPDEPVVLRVTDSQDNEIVAENGLYTIPAGGKVYVDEMLTAVIPMGVTGVTISEEAAKTLTVGTNGAMTLSGNDILLPDGTRTASVTAAGSCGESVYFAVTDGKLLISGTGAMADYAQGKAPWASLKNDLITLTVMDGVTRIGNYAFYYCGFTQVSLPNSLTSIGNRAFSYCKGLTEITLPDSVTEMGTYAFYYADKLVSVNIPTGLTYVPEAAFNNCKKLETVVLHDGVTEIRKNAFLTCAALNSLTADSDDPGVVTIPASVTAVGAQAFRGCNSLTHVTIANDDAVIGDQYSGAFAYCKGLVSIKLPANMTGTLSNSAFEQCSALESIVIPDGITTIGNKAFEQCSNLKTVTLPKSLTQINANAFNNCYSLTGVIFTGETNPTVYNNAFTIYNNSTKYLYAVVVMNDYSVNLAGLKNPTGLTRVLYVSDASHSKALSSLDSAYKAALNGGEIPAGTIFQEKKLVTPVREGYVFQGWFDDSGNALEKDADGNTYTLSGSTSVVYNARWEEARPESHTVTFNAAGGRVNGEATVTVEHGETLGTLPTASRSGYRFRGWYLDGAPFDANTAITGDITLTAHWRRNSSSRPTPPVVEIEDPDTPLVELPFEDVESDAWYKEAIDYVYSKNLMQGSSEDGFAPDVKTDRGTMAKVLYNLAGGTGAGSVELSFPDVVEGVQDVEAIYWAASHGLVVGYDNGNFGPCDNVTREQMAVMLYRYAQFQNMDVTVEGDVLKDFTDSESIGDWSREALAWAVSRRLFSGRDDGRMAPGDNATRAEVAAVVMRFHQMLEKDSAAD